MALHSLRSNKVRTFLTLLGIIIGVTSVTTIIALGEGVKQQVGQQIQESGNNILTITPGANQPSVSFTPSIGTNRGSAAHLSEEDLKIVADYKNVAAASGAMYLDGSIGRGNTKKAVRILGVTENYLTVTNEELESGQFFGTGIANQRTVILPSKVAEYLFGPQNPIGSNVTVRGTNFTVIGVLATSEGLWLGEFLSSDSVLIPLETAKEFNGGAAWLGQINFTLHNQSSEQATINSLAAALQAKHRGEKDFTIITHEERIAQTDALFKSLTIFTAAVASISLLVGGIGVMNIMLVTVTERTKEIGIRKAIGATKTQILMQFLIEALLITLTGGFIGILFSLAIGYVIGIQTALRPVLSLDIIALAAGVSLAVGIIFGTWPALRAARKDPTYALKHE